MTYSDNTIPVKRYLAYGASAVAVLTAIGTVKSSVFTVAEQERGIVTTNGRYTRVADPGLNWKTPFVQSVKFIPVHMTTLTINSLSTFTVDNQEITDTTISMQYQNPQTNVENTFKNFPDLEDKLNALAIGVFKDVLGTKNVSQFASKRGEIATEVERTLAAQAKQSYGVTVSNFQIVNAEYPQVFKDAVAKASVAKADLETATNEQKAVMMRNTTEVLTAKKNATVLLTTQRAQAEANALKVKALGGTDNVVKMAAIDKWDGALPMFSGSNGSAFIDQSAFKMMLDQRAANKNTSSAAPQAEQAPQSAP